MITFPLPLALCFHFPHGKPDPIFPPSSPQRFTGVKVVLVHGHDFSVEEV